MEATCETQIYNEHICCGKLGMITFLYRNFFFFFKKQEKVDFHLAISCPGIFLQCFTVIGEVDRVCVRLKMALRQVKMIPSGLRSEEMGKERNTRENKSHWNVNTAGKRAAVSRLEISSNTLCCHNHLGRTHAAWRPYSTLPVTELVKPSARSSSLKPLSLLWVIFETALVLER